MVRAFLRLICTFCFGVTFFTAFSNPLYAQIVVTHSLDNEEVDSRSIGVERIAFDSPLSGEYSYQFTGHQGFLYIDQTTKPSANLRIREIEFFVRTNKPAQIVMRVFQPDQLAHIRCNWSIPANPEWVKLGCLWIESADHIYITILAPKDTDLDYVKVIAVENIYVYMPYVTKPVAAAQ